MEIEFQSSGKNREPPWEWTDGDGEFPYGIPKAERLPPLIGGDGRDMHDCPSLQNKILLHDLSERTLEEVRAEATRIQ